MFVGTDAPADANGRRYFDLNAELAVVLLKTFQDVAHSWAHMRKDSFLLGRLKEAPPWFPWLLERRDSRKAPSPAPDIQRAAKGPAWRIMRTICPVVAEFQEASKYRFKGPRPCGHALHGRSLSPPECHIPEAALRYGPGNSLS